MPARERESRPHTLPGRRPHVQKEQIVKDPEWHAVKTAVARKLSTKPQLLRFFRSRRQTPFFKEFFRGRLDMAQGRGSEKFDALTNGYLNPDSPTYNPELFDYAGPILMVITAETQQFAPRQQRRSTRG